MTFSWLYCQFICTSKINLKKFKHSTLKRTYLKSTYVTGSLSQKKSINCKTMFHGNILPLLIKKTLLITVHRTCVLITARVQINLWMIPSWRNIGGYVCYSPHLNTVTSRRSSFRRVRCGWLAVLAGGVGSRSGNEGF